MVNSSTISRAVPYTVFSTCILSMKWSFSRVTAQREKTTTPKCH